MPIRPIDFQNVYLRIEDLSKNISHFSAQKAINEQIKNENINEQINKIKDKVTKIEKIIDYENRISKLLNENAYGKNGKQRENKEKKDNENEGYKDNRKDKDKFIENEIKNRLKEKFFDGKSEEMHIIDKKI
ncbi:MAG: hypothetical protein N3A58_05545 [Spirochaetes bacterium]|nr:hypothetical protein [Spirochaetota bacterium]